MAKMKNLQYIKPEVDDISSWDSQTEILYRCPKCHSSFRIYGNHEHFCHSCGQAIDWNVPTHLKESYVHPNDFKKHQSFIKALNDYVQKDN